MQKYILYIINNKYFICFKTHKYQVYIYCKYYYNQLYVYYTIL